MLPLPDLRSYFLSSAALGGFPTNPMTCLFPYCRLDRLSINSHRASGRGALR
jgi:hypothetical protein